MKIPILIEHTPLPAEVPIGGWVWTWLVPVLLFAVAFGATWMLYRKFRGE
jgi:hypothetical protein